MKLRNKKTGEIVTADLIYTKVDNCVTSTYSLAELNEEWEDYEEPKKHHYYIEPRGQVIELEFGDDIDELKEELSGIGNYFETKEEAERAVKKLKAWKRIKDKGFRFKDWNCAMQEITFDVPESFYDREGMEGEAVSYETGKDLELLFGGEE